MPRDELFTDPVDHVVHRKAPGFPLQIRVEHHLVKDISQLFLQMGRIVFVDGLAGFCRLLQEAAADGVMVLRAVPRAAAGLP